MKEKVNQVAASDVASGNSSIFRKRLTDVRATISGNLQTIRSVMAVLGSNVTSSVLGVLGGFLVARFLGPEVVGSFRVFLIPLTYLMFLNLGTNDGIQRQIPYYVGKEMPERVDAVASAAGAFNLFMSVVVSCGFICCAAYSMAHHDLYGVFGWLSQAIVCWEVFYGSYLIYTYRTMNHFVTMARIQLIQTMLTFGMVFLLPFIRFYGLCARAAFPSLLGIWLFHRNRPIKVTYRFDTKALSELIKLGIQYSFWGNLYFAAWFATESALILFLDGVTALGLFSIAYALRGAMNSLPMAVWQVLTPRVVTTFARDGNTRKVNTRIIWLTAGVTGLMIVLACVGSYFLDIFVPHVLPKYIAGIPVMKVALWFPVVQAAYLPTTTLFATGKPWLLGRSVIFGAVVFALATYLLLPLIGGLLAVAVGSLLGRAARTLAAYVDLAILTRQESAR